MVARTANHKSKVLVLTHNYPRFDGDSPGVFIENLLESLSGDFTFNVIAPHDSGLSETETNNGIEINRFRYGTDSSETLAYRGEMHILAKSAPLRFLKFMRSYKESALHAIESPEIDAIWAHWWIPGGWVGSKARRKTSKSLIITCHGTDVFLLGKFPWIHGVASRIFSTADRVTVVSNFLKERLLSNLVNRVDGLENKIVVAPMPVRDDIFNTDKSMQPVKGSIITASRLTRQKNLDKLLEALGRLNRDGIKFSLSIYGDGPEKAELTAMINMLHLGDSVRIESVLSQDELANRYRQSEIAVLVSEREGFGLTLLEAMLCGCAGVGARSGGITDIICDDGRDGILVEPGSVDAIYNALKKLLTDSEYLQKMRTSCSDCARSRFSGESISQRFRDVLDSAVKDHD